MGSAQWFYTTCKFKSCKNSTERALKELSETSLLSGKVLWKMVAILLQNNVNLTWFSEWHWLGKKLGLDAQNQKRSQWVFSAFYLKPVENRLQFSQAGSLWTDPLLPSQERGDEERAGLPPYHGDLGTAVTPDVSASQQKGCSHPINICLEKLDCPALYRCED